MLHGARFGCVDMMLGERGAASGAIKSNQSRKCSPSTWCNVHVYDTRAGQVH